jgi:hypothetical protein
MNVAVCLSGQYRTFDNDIVQRTLHEFILNRYNCDVYMSLWSNRGVSLFHGNPIRYKSPDDTITKNDVIKYIPNTVVEIEDYNPWRSSLTQRMDTLINEGDICLNAPPQLYKRNKCFQLIPKEKKYDIVIMSRPDLFYIRNLELEDSTDDNTVWNLNPEGWSHYPNRIYDIFYYGSMGTIEKMNTCYFEIESLLGDPHNSKLRKLDCCKMLYTHALNNNIKADTTKYVIGDIYRNLESVRYVCGQCNIDSNLIIKE